MGSQHPSTGDSPGPASTDESAESLSGRLPRSRRGYEPGATDALLAELVAKQTELERECARLREHVAGLEGEAAHLRRQEELVGKTLLAATSFAMKTRAAARREADLMLRNASARAVADKVAIEQLARDRQASERELLRLQQLTQEMQSGLATFLKSTLRELRPEPSSDDAGEAPASGTSIEATLATALEAALQSEQR